MTLEEMRAFSKVAELGSFTKAADALNSHTSRVSALVKDLEMSLGQDVLVRSTRALRLTDFGEETLLRITSILGAVDELADHNQSASAGTLRITAAGDYGLIRDFALAYPDVRLTINHETANADLVAQDFDIALRLGPLKDSNLKSQKLGTLRFGLFASPAYLDQNGRPKTPDDLEKLDWLRLNLKPFRPLSFKWRGKVSSVAAEPRLAYSDVASLRDGAIQGLGVARLAHNVARHWIKTKQLEQVLAVAEFEPSPLYAVHAARKHAKPLVVKFINFASAALAKSG